jgi:hypothetical protein
MDAIPRRTIVLKEYGLLWTQKVPAASTSKPLLLLALLIPGIRVMEGMKVEGRGNLPKLHLGPLHQGLKNSNIYRQER